MEAKNKSTPENVSAHAVLGAIGMVCEQGEMVPHSSDGWAIE